VKNRCGRRERIESGDAFKEQIEVKRSIGRKQANDISPRKYSPSRFCTFMIRKPRLPPHAKSTLQRPVQTKSMHGVHKIERAWAANQASPRMHTTTRYRSNDRNRKTTRNSYHNNKRNNDRTNLQFEELSSPATIIRKFRNAPSY
jgi:hypothetical protein